MRPAAFSVRQRTDVVADMSVATRFRKSTVSAKDAAGFPGAAAAAQYHDALVELVLDPTAFELVKRPGPSDWLACRHEAGQSYCSYEHQSSFSVASPHSTFNTILIVVFGREGFAPEMLRQLQQYVAAFYCPMEVVVQVVDLPGIDGAPNKATRTTTVRGRSLDVAPYPVRRCTGDCGVGFVDQLVASDLMLLASKAKDARPELRRRVIATMGLTAYDLGLDEEGTEWVYGVARATESCGVFSMARFHPSYCGGDGVSATDDAVMLRRASKVLCHELGHLFGLRHCINLRCLMNGVNHAEELNRQPLLECPACTKKLTLCLGWDLPRRYAVLRDACVEMGYDDVASTITSAILPRFPADARSQTAEPSAAVTFKPTRAEKTESTPTPAVVPTGATSDRSRSVGRVRAVPSVSPTVPARLSMRRRSVSAARVVDATD